jgi:hypothetical protein
VEKGTGYFFFFDERFRGRVMLISMIKDSAEKPLGMLRRAQHERKISIDLTRSSVRPEALEG